MTDLSLAPQMSWKALCEAHKVARPIPPFPAQATIHPITRLRRQTYFTLYKEIGAAWQWRSKLVYKKREWQDLLNPDTSQLLILRYDERDAGILHLDFRASPRFAVLELFGLMPDFIGHGLARPWLGAAMMLALHGPRACSRLRVSTCSFDHPRALPLYQSMGFQIRRCLYQRNHA